MTQEDELKQLRELSKKYGVKIPRIKKQKIILEKEEINRLNNKLTKSCGKAIVIIKKEALKCYSYASYKNSINAMCRYHATMGHKIKQQMGA